MKRIMFVDDEPAILSGLRVSLRRQRGVWDMVFVEGGQAALDALEHSRFDVVVTDMRMPGIDGATLLRRIQQDHPEVVRIVLSGHTEMEAALRTIPVAHQFLAKPCEPEALQAVIERACSLQALIGDEVVRQLVNAVASLPVLPATYSALLSAIIREDSSAATLSEILSRDLGLCAKLLQLVNSAFFRMPRRVTRVDQAVSYLGRDTLKSLVLAIEIHQWGAERRIAVPGFSLERIQDHSQLVACIARRIAESGKAQDDAYMAAMLHDVGKIILAAGFPEKAREVHALAQREGISTYEAETASLGVSHAEIGAYLLGIWGLPLPVVEAVAHHHRPWRVPASGHDLIPTVFAANLLAGAVTAPEADADPLLVPEVADYLAGLGADVPRWRELARSEAERAGVIRRAA